MSYFNFPRINFNGVVSINVGTVNNDDYSGYQMNEGPGKGQLLRLSDSVNVQPNTFGMTDEQFIPWSLTPLSVSSTDPQHPKTYNQIPGEWNYYGDMGFTFQGVNVVSINDALGKLVTSGNALIGGNLSFNNIAGRNTALIADGNPEDVPSSQIFADLMTLVDPQGNTLVQGQPSKAVTRFINFCRNLNLSASAGASGCFQCVIPVDNVSDPGVQNILKSLGLTSAPANMTGFVVRYVVYKSIPPIYASDFATQDEYNTAMENLYKTQGSNPAVSTVSGTIGIWYEGEMKSITMSRLLIAPSTGGTYNVGTHTNSNNNKGMMQLAPMLVQVFADSNRITLDISNTFPEIYDPSTKANPKYPISNDNDKTAGIITLGYQSGTTITTIATIDYTNTDSYISQGGMVDLTVDASVITAVQQNPLVVQITYPDNTQTTLLTESDYMIASDQAIVYAEEKQTDNNYRNDAPDPGPCTINVYYRGAQVTSSNAVSLVMQEAITTPNQDDALTAYSQNFSFPQTSQLTFKADSRGNRLYRISTPQNAVTSYNQINLCTDFYINLRILPTDDYSQYLNGTTPLTWDVLYDNVLRYYNLIFPAMGLHVPFEESVWKDMAATIYQRVDIENWASVLSMPRTRDLSQSRRELIQAWCKQYMPA
jgi:hypothetical protein